MTTYYTDLLWITIIAFPVIAMHNYDDLKDVWMLYCKNNDLISTKLWGRIFELTTFYIPIELSIMAKSNKAIKVFEFASSGLAFILVYAFIMPIVSLRNLYIKYRNDNRY